MSDRCAEMDEPYRPLRLVQGARGELEINTALVRRFLGIAPDEFVELTAFVEGRIHVAHCTTEADHVRLLGEADRLRGFNGAYQLVNGPIDPALAARYEPGCWHKGWNGRATDRDVRQLRAVFVDCDPERPKGISATDAEQRAALDVAYSVREFLEGEIGRGAVGFGCSGNGSFLLVAVEPTAPTRETTHRLGRFLKLLNAKFGTPAVKIDTSVANPARLMPAPGTWKRKGRAIEGRPHRMTSFICAPHVTRVPLEVLS